MMKITTPVILFCLLAGCGGNQDSNNNSTDSKKSDNTSTDDASANRHQSASDDSDDSKLPKSDGDSSNAKTNANGSSTNKNSGKSALRGLIGKLARHDGQSWMIDSNAKEEIAAIEQNVTAEIVAMTADSSVDVRRGAAYLLLERFDTKNEKMVAAFRDRLADEDKTVRHLGLTAFKRMPIEVATGAAKPLGELLRREDESPANRSDVARLLGKMGPEAAEALPALIQIARDNPSSLVRKTCLAAAARIATPAEAVPLFRQVLESEKDTSTRRLAAIQLGLLGADAAPAANGLAGLLEDADEDLRLAARDALVEIGAPSVESLVGKLKSKNARTRALAVFALGRLGSAAKPALPALKDRILDENEEVRDLVQQVIRVIQESQ